MTSRRTDAPTTSIRLTAEDWNLLDDILDYHQSVHYELGDLDEVVRERRKGLLRIRLRVDRARERLGEVVER